MGTHAKTAHKPGLIAPSAWYPSGTSPHAVIADLGSWISDHPVPAESGQLGAWYDAFAAEAQVAADAFAAAKSEGAAVDDAQSMDSALWTAVHKSLGVLTKEQLLDLAAQKGFEHPALAALGQNSGMLPLECWLDPAIPGDSPAKLTAQAMALERYAALVHGEMIMGLTLADLQQGEAMPFQPWTATLDQIGQAEKDFAAAITAFNNTAPGTQERAGAFAALIAAENTLVTADCPAMGDQLGHLKTSAAQLTAKTAKKLTDQDIGAALSAGLEAGVITAGQASVLSPQVSCALLRADSWPGTAQAIIALAATRQAQLAKLQAAHAQLTPYKPGPGAPLTLPELDAYDGSIAHAADFAEAAGQYLHTSAAVQAWASEVPGLTGPDAAAWLHPGQGIDAGELSQQFIAWGTKQDLGPLRQAAAVIGLTGAEHATKAQALQYIAGQWDQSVNVEDALAAKAPSTSGGQQPASAPPHAPAKPPPAGGKPAGFAAKHKQLVAALAQAKATATDLPPRMQTGAVTSHKFGKGTVAALGGMHAKTIHTGPDGQPWLFKPDKQARGARASAEAAASALLHAGGVPSVPVYAVMIGGKPGAVQPLLTGATQLTGGPQSWTQAEADAVVRYHVAAWMAGDHDGKPDNILRTPSGGLVPIDQGQAFKFYGTDKLDMSFHPNATYGAERPVYHQLYDAHLSGKLAPGVQVNPLVAHPVIKQYEQMPDSQLRAILHDTAHKGAASGVVAWIPAMRARAAKAHAIPESQVTKAQVAEAFLDHACERKHGLRAAFAQFFTSDVHLAGAAALRHGS